MTRAASTQKINQSLDRTHSKSAFAQFSRLEARVEREEAVSEAWDRMDGKDPNAEELKRRFQREEKEQKLNEELQRLKAATGS